MIKTFKYILAGMAVAVAAALATGCSDDNHKDIVQRERGAGYEVDLGSGLDLRFDSSGKFIGYDF